MDGRTADSPLITAYRGKTPSRRPVWFMRQAGRSLPEYRKLREGTAMLDSCLDPAMASEITLQPVRRHDVDAGIFFSDIVIPLKLAGVDVDIVPGVGPVLGKPVRTAADVAALREHKPPLIIIDMGTATAMSVLDPDGAHLGGCVCPGVKIGLDALMAKTSLLPGIQLDSPRQAVGRNTADAMRSGIMYGTAAMLDGMIDRFSEETGWDFTIVATGGHAKRIVPLCRHEIIYDQHLLSKGLAALYRSNRD